MPARVKVGLSGLGSVAQRGILPHLACEDAQERVETVACCDVVPDRARETARRFGWKEAYEDFDTMLDRADLDAVLLATPIPLHHEQTMAAIRAGKHVYVQKTMTTTVAEADEVVAASEERGVKVVASPGQMLAPAFARARRLIEEGALGTAFWSFCDTASSGHEEERFRSSGNVLSNVDPSWYYKQGGGPVRDMAVYALHALTGILGPARRVMAMSTTSVPTRRWGDRTIDVEVDDNTVMLIEFDRNVLAMVGGHNSISPPAVAFGAVSVSGSDGGLTVGRSSIEIAGEIESPSLLEGLEPAGVADDHVSRYRVTEEMRHVRGAHLELPERHVYADIMHLVDCVTDGGDPIPSVRHARHVIELMEKMYESSRTARAATLATTF
jgi:predicted dehydrogenase